MGIKPSGLLQKIMELLQQQYGKEISEVDKEIQLLYSQNQLAMSHPDFSKINKEVQ